LNIKQLRQPQPKAQFTSQTLRGVQGTINNRTLEDLWLEAARGQSEVGQRIGEHFASLPDYVEGGLRGFVSKSLTAFDSRDPEVRRQALADVYAALPIVPGAIKLNKPWTKDSLLDWAKKEFGTTDSPLDAGFILPKGELLDLKRSSFNELLDHGVLSRTGLNMEKVQKITGAIRYNAKFGIASLNTRPTDQQLKILVKNASFSKNPLMIEVVGIPAQETAKTFDRPTVSSIREWLNQFQQLR